MIPNSIVIHCSDTKNGVHLPWQQVDHWHRRRKFNGIGYHMLIQPDGYVNHAGNSGCRGLNRQGAHVLGANKGSIGICLVGHDMFHVEQLEALRYQIDGIQRTYDIPYWAIKCHYQYESAREQGKTCPNMEINRVLVWLMHADYKAMKPYLLKRSA